jgi:hypothetical protein
MESLLLINPSPRKGKKMVKKRRTAAQHAATKRLVALNRARKGHKTHAKRKSPSASYATNPAPRRAAHKRRASSGVTHARKYRRNPAPRLGGVGAMLKPAAMGAAGALLVDLVTGYVPLPLAIKVSPARHLIKGVLAIGLGMAMRGNLGRNMAQGALTVAMHDAGKEALQMIAPSIQLGAEPTVADLAGVGYYSPPPEGLGYYPSEGMHGVNASEEAYTTY